MKAGYDIDIANFEKISTGMKKLRAYVLHLENQNLGRLYADDPEWHKLFRLQSNVCNSMQPKYFNFHACVQMAANICKNYRPMYASIPQLLQNGYGDRGEHKHGGLYKIDREMPSEQTSLGIYSPINNPQLKKRPGSDILLAGEDICMIHRTDVIELFCKTAPLKFSKADEYFSDSKPFVWQGLFAYYPSSNNIRLMGKTADAKYETILLNAEDLDLLKASKLSEVNQLKDKAHEYLAQKYLSRPR